MIVSHAHKFIFLKTRKTGGSSVEIALSHICGADDVLTPAPPEEEAMRARPPQNYFIEPRYRPRIRSLLRFVGASPRAAGITYYNHMPAARVRRYVAPNVWRAYRKVTIERNPWDRELSFYFWRNQGRSPPSTFEDFITRPARALNNFEIYSINGSIIADVILRYETLGTDFSAFVESLGITPAPELPRAKGSFRPSNADYRSFYNERTREIIAKRYEREIAAFGYTF
jgi:hypothetical protein